MVDTKAHTGWSEPVPFSEVSYDDTPYPIQDARLQTWIKAGRVIIVFRRPSSESISPEHRAPK